MARSRQRTFPIEVPALRVEQPLGEFFAVSLPAHVLLDVTFSTPLRVAEDGDGPWWYKMFGGQRTPDDSRARDIAKYIAGTEAAFPNSIILGANYTSDGSYIGSTPDGGPVESAWSVVQSECGWILRIPSREKVASIIDGQHRVNGFRESPEDSREMDLLCAVYLDLPVPYQAYLFATINFNQKKVDKSLAYELFGYDVDSTHPDTWPPEKLAVFLCRRLNVEEESPLRHRIRVAAENREELQDPEQGTLVSTATIVEGILALISQNPKSDRNAMWRFKIGQGRSRQKLRVDRSPLRQLYLACEDAVIYQLVRSFFVVVARELWSVASEDSYITRTVGIQALFDVLKDVAGDIVQSRDLSDAAMSRQFHPLARLNYRDQFFQASGKGRVRLRNTMKLAMGLVNIEHVPEVDRAEYRRLVSH